MEWHLMRPEWLWALLPALLLVALLWRARGRSGSWSDIISPELLPLLVGDKAAPRGINLLPLLLLGWLLAVLAASGPSLQKIPQPIHQKQDALVLVLDLSYSMKSGDLAPSRLDRARQKLMDLLRQRTEGQTGLIAYAGDAHIVTPLTDDTPTIANLLPALNPDMMPVPGSDPVTALEQAVKLLHSAGMRQGRILLVTDGIAEKQQQGVAKAVQGSGATLAVLGVGTSTGAPIPLPRGGFLKDGSGAIVMPAMDEHRLNRIATASGGRYMPIQVNDSDLEYLLAEDLLPSSQQTLALERSADAWEDQGYLLIVLLLPLALGLFRRGWILCLLPLLLLTQPQHARAGAWQDLWLTPDQQGQRALQDGDNEAAADLFERPDWAGLASYRAEDYDNAVQSFTQDDGADAWYNRGNALARSGKLDEALAAYRESLQRMPQQRDAQENIDLLEQLQQEQEQEQQEQQQDGENQDQDENQEQEQEQEQEQQEQQEQQASDSDSQNSSQDTQDPPAESNADQSEPQNDDEQEQTEQKPDPQSEQAEESQEQQQQAEVTPADPEQQEKDQAMEQWLRRIPDDPSGLLREKFRYESQQRQQQGARRDDETYW